MVTDTDSLTDPESSGVILYDINTYTHPNWNSEINLNKVGLDASFLWYWSLN